MSLSSSAPPRVVVFDLGGVLIDWNPRYLYRKIFDTEEAVEQFLDEICTPEWNAEQDGGRPFAEGTALLCAQYPEHADAIRAYDERWNEMVVGAIEPTVRLLERLAEHGHLLYALTNWSAEKFPPMRERFPFLDLFDYILVSGEVNLKKPDPEIYRRLLERIDHPPANCLFIDDNLPNIEAAAALGFHTVHFQNPQQLAARLEGYGLL